MRERVSKVKNIRIGRISKLFSPWSSACGKCHTTWDFVRHHVTGYTDHTGMFPLCEKCWSELTPEQRLPYYRDLWLSWGEVDTLSGATWDDVKNAVLSGK